MQYKIHRIAIALASVCLLALPVRAQHTPTVAGHLVVVRLVMQAGNIPFAFEPASVTAQQGDTLRFVEDAAAMHNVRFKSHPAGARLGAATAGPYLTAKGQQYDLVVDARFTDGRYEFVCDPHEMIGMRGVLTVGQRSEVTRP